MSEHEHDGVSHTHDDLAEDTITYHEHDGVEHSHDADATPILRADATDDQGIEDESSDIVEPPAPKRQVAVIINGVNHGMRDAEEGE